MGETKLYSRELRIEIYAIAMALNQEIGAFMIDNQLFVDTLPEDEANKKVTQIFNEQIAQDENKLASYAVFKRDLEDYEKTK